MNKGGGILGNPKWRTIMRSGWENLQPSRNGFRSLGKNNKNDNQKLSLKGKMPRSWGQLPKDNSEWKVSKGLSGRQHQKEEIMRNKEKTNPLSDWHSTGSGTQRRKRGESAVPRNLRMTL